MPTFQRNFFGFGRWVSASNLPTGRFVFGNLGWSSMNVKDRLICRPQPATIRCTAICAVEAGCSPGLFLFAGNGRGGVVNAIRATDRQARQTEELPALQSREDRRKRALPPLPLQTAHAHAPAPAGNRSARGVDRRQRPARRRELLRSALQVDQVIRRRTLAVVPSQVCATPA